MSFTSNPINYKNLVGDSANHTLKVKDNEWLIGIGSIYHLLNAFEGNIRGVCKDKGGFTCSKLSETIEDIKNGQSDQISSKIIKNGMFKITQIRIIFK